MPANSSVDAIQTGGVQSRWSPVRGLVLAALLLLIIGTAGFLSIEYLKRNTQLVVSDTLAGLCDAGAANANMVEGHNRTLLLLLSQTSAERERFHRDIENYNEQVAASITAYSQSIFTPEDQANYNHLLDCRKKYLDVRKQVIALADREDAAGAQRLFKASLMPAYLEYKATGEKVFKYNADEGKSRGELIMQICTSTQFLIAGAGIVLFLTGFFMGLFK